MKFLAQNMIKAKTQAVEATLLLYPQGLTKHIDENIATSNVSIRQYFN